MFDIKNVEGVLRDQAKVCLAPHCVSAISQPMSLAAHKEAVLHIILFVSVFQLLQELSQDGCCSQWPSLPPCSKEEMCSIKHHIWVEKIVLTSLGRPVHKVGF